MEKKNLLVCQSGGPTCAINASLVGVIKKAYEVEEVDKVYGAINGIAGIMNNNLKELNFDEKELNMLSLTPSAYLGSCRHQLTNDFENDPEYKKVLSTIKKNNIGYICFIGGNDSMDTVNKLSIYFDKIKYPCNVIGVPKTIDNDLVETDHTPGYGSAIKYIATTVEELKLDTNVYEKGRVTIVEIMGRDAGWLTAGSKLACLNDLGPDLIYLPELTFDMNNFLEDVRRIYAKQKKVLVCASEGLRDKSGEYVLNAYSYDSLNDVFGHKQLGGLATVLAQVVHNSLNLPVRNIEFNLMQRCSGHITSKTDIEESKNCGMFAVENVLSTSGKFVSMERESLDNYKINYTLKDVCKVANQIKKIPTSWIVNGNDLSEEFIKYALPLVQGENRLDYINGLPSYLK